MTKADLFPILTNIVSQVGLDRCRRSCLSYPPQSAAVSSCRWQVVYESFLTFCEPILKRSANCWRPVMTSSVEGSLCFPLELEMKLASIFWRSVEFGQHLHTSCLSQRTPDEMAPFEGALPAARGSANEWLAGWNCRWTNFATWQAGENRRTPELKSVQRTPAILKEGHLWIHKFHQVFTSLISVLLQVWFSKIGTSHTHVKMCRLPHPWHPTFFSWLVNISFENRWQNRCGTWISHGFPHGWKWDPSRGSTATWR